jgi:hypothetical protein
MRWKAAGAREGPEKVYRVNEPHSRKEHPDGQEELWAPERRKLPDWTRGASAFLQCCFPKGPTLTNVDQAALATCIFQLVLQISFFFLVVYVCRCPRLSASISEENDRSLVNMRRSPPGETLGPRFSVL